MSLDVCTSNLSTCNCLALWRARAGRQAVPTGFRSLQMLPGVLHKGLAPGMEAWPENLKFHISLLSKDIYGS